MKVWNNIYNNLITKGNIHRGYAEFRVGKKKRKDVLVFQNNFKNNIENLLASLLDKTYQPGGYTKFYVKDPKLRLIHKANVVDRIVHHIVSDYLERIYEPTFIAHSYSCRKNKGTHRGVLALQKMAIKESRNNTRICWVLKCDIRKFFASVDHEILIEILSRKIIDSDFLSLLEKIIRSHDAGNANDPSGKKGMPIGNLTSQFFSNIYMNELDQHVKHTLKVKYYLRYADDFVFVSTDRAYLLGLVDPIRKFLKTDLGLDLHPQKIILSKFRSGVDFLGYIIFPKYILPRTKTKRRLLKKIKEKIYAFKAGKTTEKSMNQTIQSYYGFLVHAKAYKFRKELDNLIWFWLTE